MKSEEDITKALSAYVVEDLCPEETIFFDAVFVKIERNGKPSRDLAFGVDGEDVLLTAFIVEAVKGALAEIWEIMKPAFVDLARSGVEESKAKVLNKIFSGNEEDTIEISAKDLERIIAAARRSAVRNGCSTEQAKRISQSVSRSIKSSSSK